MGKELRMFSGLELRADEKDESPIIEGYAAMFNKRTTIWGMFTESISPQAFKRALSENQDVRTLFNHDANFVLGRTKAGTLVLREDDKGLWTETNPPKTPIADSIVESIRRGDVDGMSFAFTVKRHEWIMSEDPDVMDHREILEVGTLYDVGPVTYPAYEATSVKVRSEAERMHQEARARFEERKAQGRLIQVPRSFEMFECRTEDDTWEPDEEKQPVATEPTEESPVTPGEKVAEVTGGEPEEEEKTEEKSQGVDPELFTRELEVLAAKRRLFAA